MAELMLFRGKEPYSRDDQYWLAAQKAGPSDECRGLWQFVLSADAWEKACPHLKLKPGKCMPVMIVKDKEKTMTTGKCHRKHTPIVSKAQRGKMGAELARRRAGKASRMSGMTTAELESHLKESKGKKLPRKSKKKK